MDGSLLENSVANSSFFASLLQVAYFCRQNKWYRSVEIAVLLLKISASSFSHLLPLYANPFLKLQRIYRIYFWKCTSSNIASIILIYVLQQNCTSHHLWRIKVHATEVQNIFCLKFLTKLFTDHIFLVENHFQRDLVYF